MKTNFEKVLIAAPTADSKNYCIKNWLLNINKFTYPNFEVILVDNTRDMGENAFVLNGLAASLDLKYTFRAIHSPTDHIPSVIERMAESHSMCRTFTLADKYDYLLHLESDVFPEPDVIEKLMFHRKKVVGALYYTDHGKYRHLMCQRRIYRAPMNVCTHNFSNDEDVCFIDGTVKEIASIGLGCVLIHPSVFKNILFRFEKNKDAHPDSYFSQDCFRNGIKIFADTSLICRHENKPWNLIAGKDYE